MKKSLFVLCTFLIIIFAWALPAMVIAQQITPSVWMSAGSVGTMSNGNSYSWSMGETFTATLNQSTLTFTQGFQQLFDVPGCTNPVALNYNASATVDDGSCILPILGCMDPTAWNFNAAANTDDGSCAPFIYGCTDLTAFNYDATANTDDGSCVSFIYGCTDFTAFNYNPNANTENGSCIPTIIGCTDFNAFNFNPIANTDDGSCIPYIYGCTDITALNYNAAANSDDGSCIPFIYGCTDVTAYNYNAAANTDDGSCVAVVNGCTDVTAFNYDATANTDDGSCEPFIYGCTDFTAFNYNPNANTENGSCIPTITGCTDLNAFNFNPIANTDDGSCIPYIYGCTDITALNYNATANTDDGSCVAVVNGCTDASACNYDPSANTNDGSCVLPQLETCNSLDDNCDGTIDEGVLNTFYLDIDGDGFGVSNSTVLACTAPLGYSDNFVDCNDNDPLINTNGIELCNGADDDCDLQIDEDLPLFTWFMDNDGDGIGTGSSTESCAFLPGYATIGGDCNDNDATISPVANEICNNVDENCDGVLNDGLWIAAYIDADGDGYGANNISVDGLCELTAGYVGNNQDCDDSNPAIYSSAIEICDAIDNNCNGQIDDGLPFVNYYNDLDGDGFGSGLALNLCSNPGVGYVISNGDCDDNNASINPGTSEICGNSIDEDCNGTDLPCYTTGTPGAPIPVPGVTQYGTGVQSNISFNLAGGGNSIESPGAGNDRWYQFTAASNAARIGLKGSTTVNDDNRLILFEGGQPLGQEWIPLDTEDAVSISDQGASNDAGNETILFDQLTVGQTYLVCIQNTNNAPGNIQMSVGFLYGSATDIGPYTQYTNTYNNTCQNFKCKFKPNGKYYTIHRWNNATDDINGTPAWSYAIPSMSSTICQLGRITPPNFSGQVQNLHVTVDVQYQLPNAYGTIENLNAKGIVMGNFNLNNEAPLTVRASDACPNYKSPLYGSVATNRSVCGAAQYQWEWTMVLPNAGLPLNINGSIGGSRTLGITQVTGIDMGQKYDVRIRVKHFDQVSITPYSTVSCVRTLGSAGMTPLAEDDFSSTTTQRNDYSIAPNPTLTDELQVTWKEMQEGMVTMVIQDMTGKTIWKSIENVSGTIHHITLPHLAAGVYMMVVDQEPTRLVVQ